MKSLAMWILFSGAAMGWAPASALFGDWATAKGSVIRIAQCGNTICLTVVKVSSQTTETQDKLNPDPSLKNRALCGLHIGEGFKADNESAASGGKIYDPESGKTYSAKMERKGNSLRLRGYIGVSLLGRTESWASVPAVESCK